MDTLAPLRSILTDCQVITDPAEIKRYAQDWTNNFSPNASGVLLPRSTEEVQAIVLTARKERIALVPSGGRTGLCGGATATNHEVIVSLEKMNQILEIEPTERTVTAQAGVVTERLKAELAEHQLHFPVSIASQGSSQIGGNVSTNAGGIHVIRYGSTRQWILGLTVVTGEGKVLRTGGKLYKDQTGYDLRGLFIGSEGTLGIITEVTLAVTKLPEHYTRFVCATDSVPKLLQLMRSARAKLSKLSAFEFFTGDALGYVLRHHPIKPPFTQDYPVFGLIELEEGYESAEEDIEKVLSPLLADGTIHDAVIGQNSQQATQLLRMRELIGETLATHYVAHKNDLSVPVAQTPTLIEEIDTLFVQRQPKFKPVYFGHLGDGNIHLNIPKPSDMEREVFFEETHKIDAEVFQIISKLGGSISAEHGIGLLKRDFLHFSRSEHELQYMRSLKQVFDPDGVLNPGKIFPAESPSLAPR